jgi:hypothetical protein
MAKVLDALDDGLIDWIGAQHVFFVASAPSEGGHVNLSPKGHDVLRVLGPHAVAYLDLTGSGAETMAHTRENGRLTIMFCAFEGPPRILRLFGRGTAHALGSDRFAELSPRFADLPGERAIVELAIERIQTSCGYAVPFMDYREERPTLQQWAARQDDDELAAYRRQKNAVSIDQLPAFDA